MENPKTYSYEEALSIAKDYFNNEDMPSKVWLDKYALRNSNDELLEASPHEMHQRIARELARIESDKFKEPYKYNFILECIQHFGYIIPQGSIMYGIGNPYKYITLSNCYVLSTPSDSYGGILHTDQELVQISKRRGGCGLDLSKLRPAGSITNNSSRTSTGILSFAKRYSNSIREVGQSGRRGALMETLSIHHPQILDFINAKRDLTQITGANISVRLSDEFLTALENNGSYQLRFPVDLKEGETPTISKQVDAKEVWNSIIDSAWTMAEPGLLFWDNIIRESPADCYDEQGFTTVCVNPCAELPLCELDSCRLLLLNLLKFVDKPFTSEAEFNFTKFYKYAQIAQRFMDDIIDLELEAIGRIIHKILADPEPDDIKENELNLWRKIYCKCQDGRRTGTGITALGDTLAALGIQYGSDDSIDMTNKIYQCLKFGTYRSSIDMAKELGPFPVFDHNKEKDNPFLNRIKDEAIYLLDPNKHGKECLDSMIDGAKLYEDMKQYGRRNIACLTTAPAGSVSILAEVDRNHKLYGTTSGIEPCYQLSYLRKKKVNPSDEGVKIDEIDETGDSWQHFEIFHPTYHWWSTISGEVDKTKSPWYNCTANDINWVNRVKIQAAATKHIDHSISSTINLPEDVSKEEVSKIYTTAWKAGCKGITVYRNNCRSGVLVDNSKKSDIIFTQVDAIKRPKELPCDIHYVSVKHQDYYIVVGKINNNPYELFILDGTLLDKFTEHDVGKLIKVKRHHYRLSSDKDNIVYDNIAEYCSHEQEVIARLTSVSLRHGSSIQFIVEQLNKSHGDIQSVSKAIARVLKKYIKDGTKLTGDMCQSCKSNNLIYSCGCCTCADCGWSKC